MKTIKWLTILLHVGPLAHHALRKNVRDHSIEHNSSTDCSSCSGEESTQKKLGDIDKLNPDIHTLRMQFGFINGDNVLFANAKVEGHTLSPYLMSNINFMDVSKCNRTVLMVSGHIDFWMALVACKPIKFLFSFDLNWKKSCVW